MGDRYDYYVSGDGTPSDDVVDTTWLDPVVHLGWLHAELNGGDASLHLQEVDGHVDRVPDGVRDALADVTPDRLPEVGARWAASAELAADDVSAAEATALLHDLVGLCVTGRDTGHGLYVART